ncbi:MAG TPA: ATP-binding cassette domain-containing protein [Edaphobacter sp.]|nr:ATP-binding cassette domain-containing protein [Edaphobacter sp.]
MIYSLNNVGKEFGEGRHRSVAVRNVTLHVSPGEQITLIGPSGAGKTTLFRLMNGSLFPSSGKLLYRESDLAATSHQQLREMRRRIGSIYQQHYLVAGMSVLANTLSGALGRWGMVSTLRNLASPSAVEVERAERCLEAVGLADKRRFRCEQLSGGQQQRLAIARTLMQEPEVILADEPVASLDPMLSNEILELLVRLTEEAKLTLLTSLHQVDLALRHSKRIVGLRCGEINFDAPSKDVDRHSLAQLYRGPRERDASPGGGPFEESGGAAHGAESGQKGACLR